MGLERGRGDAPCPQDPQGGVIDRERLDGWREPLHQVTCLATNPHVFVPIRRIITACGHGDAPGTSAWPSQCRRCARHSRPRPGPRATRRRRSPADPATPGDGASPPWHRTHRHRCGRSTGLNFGMTRQARGAACLAAHRTVTGGGETIAGEAGHRLVAPRRGFT